MRFILKLLKLARKHWRLLAVAIYLIFPIDIIPDALLPVGYMDDIILIMTAIIGYLRTREASIKNKPTESDGLRQLRDQLHRKSNTNHEVLEGEVVDE